MRYLVTAGNFDEDCGKLLELEWDAGTPRLHERLVYHPPPDLRVSGKGFAGGSLVDGDLWVCSFAAVHKVRLDTMEVVQTVHHPWFNDLHHVCPRGGTLLVCNTGLDRVEALAVDGSHLGAWSLVSPDASRDRLAVTPDPDPYFDTQDPHLPFCRRKVQDLVHPNHVTVVGQRILLTRFLDRRVDNLVSWSPVLEELPGLPHDGVVTDGLFWITCTNGLILAYPILSSGQIHSVPEVEINVFKRTGRTGWCRGLAVGDDYLVVGLTAIHHMPRQRWCDLPFDETESSVLILDRSDGSLLHRVSLDGLGGHPKVFGILPWPRTPLSPRQEP